MTSLKSKSCTKVCLQTSQSLLREGLRLFIETESDLRISSAEDADVTIVDLSDEDALDSARQNAGCQARFVALTESCELDELDQMLRAGVRGVVVKSAHAASLLQAVRSVSKGMRWLDPEIQEMLANPESTLPSPHERWRSLTQRERQVAELVLQGLRYKDIAISLAISDHTVRNHLRNIFAKLHISSRVELAPYANETVST